MKKKIKFITKFIKCTARRSGKYKNSASWHSRRAEMADNLYIKSRSVAWPCGKNTARAQNSTSDPTNCV